MTYRSCIKDELGEVVVWCDKKTNEELKEYLKSHPEYSLTCEEIIEDFH